MNFTENRIKEIKKCYIEKHNHRKEDDSAVAYIVLSHAPVISSLVSKFSAS